ncbi:bifunctional phosphopantothenoylcysteine decarboxylase/phosphopantothenate--cysteine ligase CoaBC [Sphingobacterium griseoflavum]|uniref:Coenzyme A biosynthesis bifunctional protein CoaBC n=1 Tax=Sphingobacterium griseoflavum TaxID=1474952 RepID=A0ABQ3HZ39_9SPHI|nr:bifunctional phosphopantothenoylcysteine decarboxylase/phosphopantothenate--cysteine ligase CoaBC [Sphingobacterium griseoflavum]GHE46237.1 phosphopantothenoylcysteine decarboxylase [Sphingobacterium griseoflavum]
MPLKDKNIVIGICGGIAAYKITYLVRSLVKAGAQIQVIMSPDAKSFVTPLTFATLSKNPVYTDYFDSDTGVWHNHVDIARKADLIVIAPATANTLSKMANGACDNLLLATYLSAKCPVMFAPAMDLDMWQHPSTQENVDRLRRFGNILLPPGKGELASGLVGEGRLAEPEEIYASIHHFFDHNLPLKGKKALVTAGPTYEAIDPVRFIGNHSSGKMGFAIAASLVAQGASVQLISGPTHLDTPQGVERLSVISAQQMFQFAQDYFNKADIIVMSAAVADYTPVSVAEQKIKKHDDTFQILLQKTTDILGTLGKQKTDRQTLVGFALETNDELQNAKEKLARKNLDFIVLNSMRDQGAGFAGDNNKVTILGKDGMEEAFPLKSKREVADDIVQLIVQHQSAINGQFEIPSDNSY